MPPQTIVQLQEKIDRDLAWRKKEIVAILRATARVSASKQYYCRAGVVMLCAHWEGFLKKAVGLYVKFVFSQELKYTEMSDHFVAISFYDDVVEAAKANYPGARQHHLKLSKKIRDATTGPARWKVGTHGNPSSEVLSCLMESIGIDGQLNMSAAEWVAAKTFVDSLLLAERHKIAHGEGLQVDSDVFRERVTIVLSLCQAISDAILAAAQSESYRVACQEPGVAA
ncbi:MAE_28990/MAE_18760 family HEPN-like nuclease [Stenotrophomonas rhizophila]|uniref:MAE_28990/MAE_18760 family HEPN-like nuclease n=1 Tax=Stenotrophomonas rhizophila TaxID=216778 RepID=UPI00163A69F0|nr:MAE_28990/MAE_18760 family HEPN-like nuclease [Stenotrophomonas rhizophila]